MVYNFFLVERKLNFIEKQRRNKNKNSQKRFIFYNYIYKMYILADI